MASARADLDAFADAAAAFAGDQEEPTLGAFLAYLTAQGGEFGLESGRVGDGDTVTLATVHASKGLQWAAVVVPGLSAGRKAQVFPAKPRFVSRWTENARLVPLGCGVTPLTCRPCPAWTPRPWRPLPPPAPRGTSARSAGWPTWPRPGPRSGWPVPATGGETRPRRSVPSVFLEEVRAACEAGAGTVAYWAESPEEKAENPALAEPPSATWPAEPQGRQQEAVREAADLVHAALDAGRAPACPGQTLTADGPGPAGRLGHRDRAAPGRARGMARRGRLGGLAASATVRVLPGDDGPRPGRAGPADQAADAAAAGPAGPPGHRVPPLAGGAVQPAAPDRPRRPPRCRQRPGRG